MAGIELKKIWMDGKLVPWKKAQVHVLTHALHYGTAIFEGLRCYSTKKGPAVFRLKDHIARLYRGAKSYHFEIPYSQEQFRKAVFQVIKVNKVDHCYIRPIIYLGYKTMGLSMKDVPVKVAIAPVRFDHYFDPKKAERGLHCCISSWHRISVNQLSPHVKASANYMNSVLAKAEAEREGFDEAIMLTDEGHVSEGTGENIFLARKGKLITPPFYDSVLGGVTRESVIEMAKDLGYVVEEKSVLRDELYTADEVFMTGTASEINFISRVDDVTIGKGKKGPITAALQKKFRGIVTGKEPRYEKWLEYVR
ncbi:MAG: branched-chain amino acid transaminase [Candidatus Micrarchaeota archaeon]|nr:branched-chain amino acid transaminase [Candidatus Micrarchaeota archaeon]